MSAIPELRGALYNINPSGQSGNCTKCAVEAAKVLTKGRMARPVTDDSSDIEAQKYEARVVRTFEENGERAAAVRTYLFSSEAKPGVYGVNAGEDHAYNFVKTSTGKLYVVDSNLHIYFSVGQTNPKGFKAIIEGEKYNYSNPDEGPMTVFYWGPLELRWNEKLNVAD